MAQRGYKTWLYPGNWAKKTHTPFLCFCCLATVLTPGPTPPSIYRLFFMVHVCVWVVSYTFLHLFFRHFKLSEGFFFVSTLRCILLCEVLKN